MSRIETALAEKGITLPDVAPPAGAYVPAARCGDLVQTSGQLPFVAGELAAVGKLGDEITAETGYDLARISIINALAAVKSVLGDLDDIAEVVKVTGFVNSTPDFTAQPTVLNGASELLGEVFGKSGEHVRSAVGVAALPLGSPVEVELTVRVRTQA